MASKKAGQGVDRRFSQAVEAFDKAVRALGKHDYEKARDLLDQVIENFPEERDLLDRARSYRLACQRALRKPAARPKTATDLLALSTLRHNEGDFDEAVKLQEAALAQEPGNDDALYCLAASAAQAGDHGRALEALTKAIEIARGNRAQARGDSDFDPLREDEAFIDLIYAEA